MLENSFFRKNVLSPRARVHHSLAIKQYTGEQQGNSYRWRCIILVNINSFIQGEGVESTLGFGGLIIAYILPGIYEYTTANSTL